MSKLAKMKEARQLFRLSRTAPPNVPQAPQDVQQDTAPQDVQQDTAPQDAQQETTPQDVQQGRPATSTDAAAPMAPAGPSEPSALPQAAEIRASSSESSQPPERREPERGDDPPWNLRRRQVAKKAPASKATEKRQGCRAVMAKAPRPRNRPRANSREEMSGCGCTRSILEDPLLVGEFAISWESKEEMRKRWSGARRRRRSKLIEETWDQCHGDGYGGRGVWERRR